MVVERHKDGSISIKDNSGASVISKIVGVSDDTRQRKFQQWVEDCAKLVTACAHTHKETEQYFLTQCDALPIAQGDRRMKNFQLNVVMNYCKDKLKHQAPEFSFDMRDEEMEKWHEEEDAMRQEAMNSSPEQFGLNIRGYYLPQIERNRVFYEQAYPKLQKLIEHTNQNPTQIEMQDICFFFEETTEHCQCNGGGDSLLQQLIVFRGISQADIEECSPRFLSYISTLRDMGNLPNFI